MQGPARGMAATQKNQKDISQLVSNKSEFIKINEQKLNVRMRMKESLQDKQTPLYHPNGYD